MLALRLTAVSKRRNKLITERDVCRLHFNEGELYGILTWDDEAFFMHDLDVQVLKFENTEGATTDSTEQQIMQFVVEGYINSYFETEFKAYKAQGMWGCGNCGDHFTVPNSDNKKPWCCPFCCSQDINEDKPLQE